MASATKFAPVQGTFGPDHFNEIINQPCNFIDEDGKMIETTVHHAAKSAEACAERLFGRVKAHYKALDRSRYPQDQEQYKALSTLVTRIRGVVQHLKQDRDQFVASDVSGPESCVITTRDDLTREISELEKVAAQITSNYLTKGTVRSYLPDYLDKLKAGSEKKA